MELDLSRVRRPSRRFGWVDRRVLTDGRLDSLGLVPVCLYLVLCVVADRHGVSWYASATLAGLVQCPPDRIRPALDRLVRAGLVTRSDRYIQVLDLDCLMPAPAVSTALPPARQPTPQKPAVPTACERLAQIPPDLREELLSRARARLALFLGRKEPRRSVLEALAAGLIDQGTIR